MPRWSKPSRPWVLAAVLLAAVALPAAAQWKWRDKTGQMQYSDLPPPPSTPEADILQRPSTKAARYAATPVGAGASAASQPAAKASAAELDAKHKKAQQDEAAKAKADEERQAMARLDNCSRARGQLKALDDGLRIVRYNAKGEREVLDDKGRAEEAQRARETIARDCK